MEGGRKRQRKQLRTVSIACMLVCVRALKFDQWLLCYPSWITADKQARTYTRRFVLSCGTASIYAAPLCISVITQRSLFEDLQKELSHAAESQHNKKGQHKMK